MNTITKQILAAAALLLTAGALAPPSFSFAQNNAVPFTLEDRDRSIRMEEKLNSQQKEIASLRNEMNTRFESQRNEMNTRFESIDARFDTLYWAFGIIVALVLFQLGYTIWDRRTTLYPLLERTHHLSEKGEQLKREVDDLKDLKKLKEVIKEYAQTDTKLAELLRRAAIL